MFAGYHHPDNPFVICGTSIEACGACPSRCAPIEQVRLVWRHTNIDRTHYHNDPNHVSVTETQNCLLKSALARTVDYSETIGDCWKRVVGTLLHVGLEMANQDGQSEVRVSEPIGRGYYLTGTMDRCTDEYIMDYKSMDSFRKTVDEQHVEQLSIYREMCGHDGDLLLAQVTRKGINVIDLEPINGALSACRERARELIDAVESGDLHHLPPLGRQIKFFRARQCDYCPHAIKSACDEIHPTT